MQYLILGGKPKYTVTKFLRKIPKETSLRYIYSAIKRVINCNISDFKIHQPIPDAQFKGKWKFVSITMSRKDAGQICYAISIRVTVYPGFSTIYTFRHKTHDPGQSSSRPDHAPDQLGGKNRHNHHASKLSQPTTLHQGFVNLNAP